ncbi:MAG: hypothetical protein PHN51_10330 [Candidatus Nanopelagicales bacterium]|nr:hypothetical protein [Candidatus Nanopelagicales bacterium]
MPYKVGKLYCAKAEGDGTVIEKTDKLITVEYKTGKVVGYRIGNTYGRMEGSVYKHSIATTLDKGKKVSKDDIIAYNTGFFEPDWLNPSRLIMKFNQAITVALSMEDSVYEDSSAVSPKLSKEASTSYIKEKIFVLEFQKNIINLLPEGSKVTPNDVLFTVVDENADYSNLSESSIEMLKHLSNVSPKAKMDGTIFRYEMKYNGELSDMSPTVKKLAQQMDKQLYEETRHTFEESKTNRENSEYRSEGKNLLPNTFELKVFIETKLTQAVADKGVFGSQMKSVVSDVFRSDIRTESGDPIDAKFSYVSIVNRVTESPILMGLAGRIMKKASRQVADIYFGS